MVISNKNDSMLYAVSWSETITKMNGISAPFSHFHSVSGSILSSYSFFFASFSAFIYFFLSRFCSLLYHHTSNMYSKWSIVVYAQSALIFCWLVKCTTNQILRSFLYSFLLSDSKVLISGKFKEAAFVITML